ncbi:MAG: hypothetical protein JOZ87_22925 [Chloroflexi bacterium]|nr:hypothetical protein [Chloroflexota bacterium]
MILIGVALVGLVLTSGYAVVRLLGLAKGASAAALIPAAGLAFAAVLTSWCGLLGAPPPTAGILVLGCCLIGMWLIVLDREWLRTAVVGFMRQDRLAAGVFGVALIVPLVTMAISFAQVQAPLSPADGAYHVETIDLFRRGTAVSSSYPPGLAALFAAILQLAPWIDTATGGYGLALGLTLLAPIAVFGLGVAIWQNLRAASAAALLSSLTELFPYNPQTWGGWPQLLGILLVLGLWVVAIGYLAQPGWQWALLAGLLLGAMVLVHGTELYTSAIVLLIVACGNWRTMPWRRLGLDGLGAFAFAVLCAALYMTVLLHWAAAGGPYEVGNADGAALQQGTSSGLQNLAVYSLDALGIDFPVRIALLALGLVFAFRFRVGRAMVAVTLAFVALAVVVTLFNGVPIVRMFFASTYPWSLPYRHLTFASIGLAMIAGGGCVQCANWWSLRLAHVRAEKTHRRITRLGRLLVVVWLALSSWALITLIGMEASAYGSFSADDAAAMAWMRANLGPSDVVVNDTYADAGIWAPYKAGVQILVHRAFSNPDTQAARQLVVANVADLESNPSAAAAACALHARYVYYGAAHTKWITRTFPPIEELRASPALQQVFGQGNAAVFAINLPCG